MLFSRAKACPKTFPWRNGCNGWSIGACGSNTFGSCVILRKRCSATSQPRFAKSIPASSSPPTIPLTAVWRTAAGDRPASRRDFTAQMHRTSSSIHATTGTTPPLPGGTASTAITTSSATSTSTVRMTCGCSAGGRILKSALLSGWWKTRFTATAIGSGRNASSEPPNGRLSRRPTVESKASNERSASS